MVNLYGYDIQEKIYEGLSSIVYRAQKSDNEKRFILKILKKEESSLIEIEKLKLEYQILKKLEHEGIIKVSGIETFDNSIALVFDDFDSVSLDKYLKLKPLINLKTFLTIAIKICQALEYLHKNNIVHKNLNPSNILINQNTNNIKLIDFSNSSVITKENKSDSSKNIDYESLTYVSPEQTGRINRPIDYRTDFYSLGVTFYEMLTDKPPFYSKDPMELIHFHIAKKPKHVYEVNKDVPRVISDMVMKLLEKNPEDRYKSVYGLKFDLEVCLEKLENSQAIDNFLIGNNDVFDKLTISQRMYGREDEIASMQKTFENIKFGYDNEIVLISGRSGMGKTTLVNNFQKKLIQYNSYFIFGKFEQIKKSIPYSSIIQALKGLIKLILTEQEDIIKNWKNLLLKELNSNAQIIIDVIPELEFIIGKQAKVQELPAVESQNRFKRMFQKFIKVFAQRNHPLILFLDDLQWADSETLNLLESIILETNTKYFLFIGSYRDNEIYPLKDLLKFFSNLKDDSIPIKEISLVPLTVNNIAELLGDTFGYVPKDILDFAKITYSKTNGNPFFINQFLNSLYENQLIEFNAGFGWAWEISKIEKMQITENVVDLMEKKITKLPKNTQEVLKLASCIGNKFDFETLLMIYGKSSEETFQDLSEAINEGIILIMEDCQKFLHDKVQEAAYSLMSEQEKKEIHYKIGYLLLNNTKKENLDDKIFDIVNHLNISIELLNSEEEKEKLANLNLQAGKKAKLSTAYNSALKYLKIASTLINNNTWQKNHDLKFSVSIERAECEYIAFNFFDAEELFEDILQNTNNLEEISQVYYLKILLYTSTGEPERAIQAGLKCLKSLGVKVKSKFTFLDLMLVHLKVKLKCGNKKIQDLLDLPDIKNKDKENIMKIMSALSAATYNIADLFLLFVLGLNIVELSLKYGNSSYSSYGYLIYGIVLETFFSDYKNGYEFGKLALNLNEKFEDVTLKTKLNYLFATFINCWTEHIDYAFKYLDTAHKTGIESGNFYYASLSSVSIITRTIQKGYPLGDTHKKIQEYIDFSTKFKYFDIVNALLVTQQFVLNLEGKTLSKYSLNTKNYNESDHLQEIKKSKFYRTLNIYYISKLQILYLFRNYPEALNIAVESDKVIKGTTGDVRITEHYFYYSLVLIELYNTISNTREKNKYLKIIKRNQKMMKKWADSCPENFLHKYLLVEAEIAARINSKTLEAIELYNKSILIAQRNGFTQIYALANELAAKFYLTKKYKSLSKEYILEAYNGYLKWGAKRKLKDIEEEYPNIFRQTYQDDIIRHRGTSSLIDEEIKLDFITIMKAAQTISGEIHLEKLLDKLMKIVIESAGAQRGLLILKDKNDELCIEAEGSIDNKATKIFEPIKIKDSNLASYPIIKYVELTKNDLVLNDVQNEGMFISDQYIIRYQPKSVLCIPIIKQTEMLGILYLENNLVTGVFTSDRIKILKLLSSQVAISLENARLYKQLEENKTNLEKMVEERTKELRETQEKLIDSAHSSGMAEIATGVLHDIGNLLNSVNISTQVIIDTVKKSKIQGLLKANEMLLENIDNIGDFFSNNDKGKKLPQYYISLGEILKSEHLKLEDEGKSLAKKIAMMKNVITTQQTYAKTQFFNEKINPVNIVEDAMAIKAEVISKNNIRLNRKYYNVPDIYVQKTKLINVLMNLIKNSTEAMVNNEINNKILTIEINQNEKEVYIKIYDNGDGILKENLSKIFNHGFTTKKSGHGFGLHTCANSVKEMNGKIIADSEGLGKGASFTISFAPYEEEKNYFTEDNFEI